MSDITPLTPISCRPMANYCNTTPRRRSGKRRTQSDTYRKVALTRSASQALRIQKPIIASRSYSFRNKHLLLELLADSALSDLNKNNEKENSIQKITPALEDSQTSSKSLGNAKISKRKVKATSIKLNLLKSSNA